MTIGGGCAACYDGQQMISIDDKIDCNDDDDDVEKRCHSGP
jgi:hypothetical protein